MANLASDTVAKVDRDPYRTCMCGHFFPRDGYTVSFTWANCPVCTGEVPGCLRASQDPRAKCDKCKTILTAAARHGRCGNCLSAPSPGESRILIGDSFKDHSEQGRIDRIKRALSHPDLDTPPEPKPPRFNIGDVVAWRGGRGRVEAHRGDAMYGVVQLGHGVQLVRYVVGENEVQPWSEHIRDQLRAREQKRSLTLHCQGEHDDELEW